MAGGDAPRLDPKAMIARLACIKSIAQPAELVAAPTAALKANRTANLAGHKHAGGHQMRTALRNLRIKLLF